MASTPDPRLQRAGVSGYNKPKRTPKGKMSAAHWANKAKW